MIKFCKLNGADFAVIAAVMGGVFLLLEIVVSIVMAAARPDTVAALGGMILPCVALLLCLVVNTFQIPTAFDFILRFGVTRRQALARILFLMAAETVFAFALSLLLTGADRLIATLWTRARPGLGPEEFAIPLWGVALMAAAGLAVGLIGGSLIQVFGRKGLWIIWVVYLGAMAAINTMDWGVVLRSGIPAAAIAAAAAVLLAACAWSVWSLLRATVKG